MMGEDDFLYSRLSLVSLFVKRKNDGERTGVVVTMEEATVVVLHPTTVNKKTTTDLNSG